MKWIKVKLTDISKPKQWKNLPISELSENGFLVYGANGIIGKYKEYNHEFPTLAITCRGATCGTLNITEPKSYITSNAMALDGISENVNQKFLYYALKKRGFKDIITGAAQPQITGEGLSKIILSIPENISDQIQIANVLSKAETLIEQRKKSIALLDDFLKSTYSEMFGQMNEKNYPLERLDDISTKINDGEHGSVEKTETGVLYLMARNINRFNEIDLKEISFVSREAHNKMFKRCNPEKGDILIVCVGATIGKVVIVPEMEEFSIARSVALVKPDYKKVNSKYLLWYFNSALAKRQIKSSSLTAAQAGLYIGKIKEIKIPVPPLTIQNKFSAIVTKAEILKEEYKSSLVELENLYGSLSQKAFKGELEFSKQKIVVEN